MIEDEFETEIGSQLQNMAKRLREEREKARISQMDLSFASGLAQNQVNYIETGQRTPNLHTLLKICNALNINAGTLFFPLDEERAKQKERIISMVSRL
jgi:transcriptional regulator with XRE-family HTH domain